MAIANHYGDCQPPEGGNVVKLKPLSRAVGILAVAMSQAANVAIAQEEEAFLEEVMVTGSRIQTDGSQAPVPVTMMSNDELTMMVPSNLPDALNKLPQFTGSFNQNAGGTFNATSEPLGNYLNLRGLDSSRVLTMLNGQRMAPSGLTNAVDANIIPQLLVKRVDIVTGGASAAYGSDAVSGVVNFILDDKYEGIKIDVNAGASGEGDNESFKGAIAGGFAISDRAHVLFSAEHYNNDGIPSIWDRDWTTGPGNQIARSGAGTAESPYRTSDFGNWIGQSIHRNIGIFQPAFTKDGTLVFPVPEADFTSFGTPDSGGTSITGTLETSRYFGKLSYDFTDSLRGHVTAFYSESETTFNSTPNNTTRGTNGYNRSMRVFGDNPFLNPQTKAALNLGDDEYIGLTSLYNDIGVVTNVTENEYTSIQFGLAGEFNDNWSWDATYNWAESTQKITFNEFKMKEVWAAMDAVLDPSGNIVCGVTLRNPGFMDDCRPLNVMGAYNFTQEARDYVRGDSIKDISNEMEYFTFNIQGDLMELAGGPLQIAVGAEYRTQDLDVVSNSDPGFYTNADGTYKYEKFVNDHMGIRGIDQSSVQAVANYRAGVISEGELQAALGTGTVPSFTALRYSSVNQGGAVGNQDVTEFYAELNAPLTENLAVNVAARSTDYKTSGQVETWKAGFSWNVTDSVRIRATQSRDIAAPTLNLLYAAPDPSFGQFIDPHIDGTVEEQTIVPLYIRSGNENLEPEQADTTTIGVVFQPQSIPGLTMSIDWWSIEIEDAFGNLSPSSIADECEASNGQSSLCDYIVRPLPFEDRTVANAATQILMVPFNLAMLTSEGIDFEVGYTFDALGGVAGIRAFVSHVDSYTTQQTSKDPVIERAGYTIPGSPSSGNSLGLPEWKGMIMETYTRGGLSLMLSQRMTGKWTLGLPGQVWAADDPNIPGGKIDNEIYLDANIAYRFGNDDKYMVYLNAQNLTDVEPPTMPGLAPNLTIPADKLSHDVIGRSFTLGARVEF